MGKRKIRAKRKNLKKIVKQNVKKIKEKNSTTFTVQDLALNPALLYSPQFKALPMEKQFQLTSQLKQLKAMRDPLGQSHRLMPMMFTGGNSSSGSDIYTKFMDSNRKVQEAQNETQQLRVSIDANTKAVQEELQIQKQLRQAKKDNLKKMKHKDEMEKTQEQIQELNEKVIDKEVEENKQQVDQLKNKLNVSEILKNQKKLDQLSAQREILTDAVQKSKTPKPRHEGDQRITSELMRSRREEKLTTEQNLAYEMQALADNGENKKSEKVEKELLDARKQNVTPNRNNRNLDLFSDDASFFDEFDQPIVTPSDKFKKNL